MNTIRQNWNFFAGGEIEPRWVMFYLALVYLSLAAIGRIWFDLSLFDSLAFLGSLALAFYMPGSFILLLAGDSASGALSRTVLAVALGFVVIPFGYGAVRALGLDFSLVWAFFLLLASSWFLLYRRSLRSRALGETVALPDIITLTCLLLAVLVLLLLSHFGDVRFIEEGFLINTSRFTESVYHLGIVYSLQDTYPPPALYASGSADLSYYHLGMHLQIDMIARMSGVDILRLATFYFPLLYFSLLVSLPYIFVKTLGGSVLFAGVCGLLVFGSGFSFVPGLLLNGADGPWILYFAPAVWGLFTLNGYIPGTIALFTSLYLLWRYLDERQLSHLLIFAIGVVGSFVFKSSMALQLAAATVATGAIWMVFDRGDRRGAQLLFSGLFLSVILLAWSLKISASTDAVQVRFMPFALFHSVLDIMGISYLELLWYPVLMALFLVGALGVRAVGLWTITGAMKGQNAVSQFSLFVLLFFVIGYVLSEFLFLGQLEGLNNSLWFYIQSLTCAWFALFAYLARSSISGLRAVLLSLGLIALAAPSTMQFLYYRSKPDYRFIGRDESAVIELLGSSAPDSVVLHPLNRDVPSLASNFAGRPSVLSIFQSFVVEEDGRSERIADIDLFFAAEASQVQRVNVLRKYGVDYLYMPSERQQEFLSTPGLLLELETPTISVFRVLEPIAGSENP